MCTGIKIALDNHYSIYARTLEFGVETNSNVLMIPRKFTFSGTTANGTEGLKWSSRYAVLGANMLNITGIIDGINEVGLAGGLFYFPNFAEFQAVEKEDLEFSIAPWELITWLLTNFSSVDEVRKHLPAIKVAPVIFNGWGIVPPVHAIVHDACGNSLVIEYIKGKLIMYDNPLGVFTNSPSFEWHITNLSNYINLSPFNVKNLNLKGLSLVPLGQGSGMLGLPGDFTSPSRFVRATIFMQALVSPSTEQVALESAFHILNLFDIPLGSIIEKTNNIPSYEFTQWTSASDLKNKRYYWHTYNNRQIYMADLMKMNLDAHEPHIIPMHNKASIVEAE